MLFINFLCLLYLMVLSNSHTISKSIDIDDGTDEVSETITNLDNTRYHRLRRQNHRIDRIHQKYRLREIPSRLPDVTEASLVSTKTTSTEAAYTDTIAVNNASTANPTYRSHKRKIGGFWRKFRAKAKTTTNNVNVQNRQVAKRNTHGQFKHGGVKKFIYSNPRNRKKKFYSFIFQQPKTVSEDDDLEVTVDVPLKKKDNNVKFLYTPYVMYASKLTPAMIALMNKAVNNKTTESMNNAIASMNTHLSELKKMYGAKKEILPTVSTTTSSYPGTAEIEELLTGIKMKAIQTVVENAPSMVDLISNTVTEAIYRSMHSGYMSTPFSRYLVSTLNIDNILSRPGIEFNEHHNLVTRSITKDPLTLSNIEEILQKELKNIYHKMKCKMTKDPTKYKPQLTSNGTTTPMQPMPVTTTPNNTATTNNNNNNATTNATTTSIMSTTSKSKSKAPKTLPQPIKSSVKPPTVRELSGKNQSVSISRLERENTLTDVSSRPVMEANVDDYNMLIVYEKMLRKVQEDNAMKLMATANLPLQIQKNERCRLSKRNPETLTDIKLKETVETLYNDGVIMPDYDYLKLMSTQPSNTVDDKGYEPSPSTSYDELSKKIAYDDFVNGYKHYLKFQQEKAKEDNFSAMVKYQAHKHHRVDDIGKYILDKIPQLPPESTVSGIKRLKRFFEDMDMEDQEVSTKTDDSWFRKHFYIFLDYGPPKKFHTSQIVSLKPPIADVSLDSTKTLNNHSTSVTSMLWEFKLGDKLAMKSSKSKTTQPINLDELTKSLDIMKNIPKNLFYEDNTKPSKETESSTQYVIGWTLPMKMLDKRTKNEDEPKTTNQDIESVTKPINAKDTYLTDRHKRANESIADDFGIKEQDEKSSTPVKEMQSDVMLQNKNKNKFGYVDVNLVPTNSITLRVNKTKSIRKNKFRDFLKKFHFKSPKSKKKEKRACTDKRVPRFNPFKRIKNMFKPTAKTTTNVYMEDNKTSIINRIVTKFNPLNSPLVEKAVGKHKTTKYSKYAMDMGDLQIPTLNDSSSKFSMSETLKKYPPISFPPSQPTPKIIPMIPVIPAKLSTFLMMMDDGRKSVLYVQPETVHKSTRKMKPPKTKFTTVRTLSTKMTPQTSTDVSEVLSVSVKTLRPLSSVVMKALTSTCNETLPDLNLEIAKMQYGLGKTVPPPKIKDSRPSTSYLKSISRVPLVKPRIEGLTYNNQLTRFAKLSLNPTKYLKTRQNMKISGELKPFDYHVYDDYNQEIVEKDQFERRSTRPGSEKNFKNVDYFNDLLMWNNDILNIDKVPQPEWRDLVKSVEKDFGAEEYTTPNKYTLMHELKELDMTMGKPRYISKISKAIKNFGDVNTVPRNINEGMVRHVALNDKAVVKSKDFIIKGEQKYFQYNKPNVISDFESLSTTTMQFPMWNSERNENFNGSTGTSMWSNGNITIKSPFKWVNDKGKHEDPNKVIHNKPIIWLPERHIIFSPNRTHTKNNGNLHLTIPNPITWGSYDKAKQSEDCLTKMARKFYIGGKPKQPKIKSVDRILRVTSPSDNNTVSENKVKAAKVKISEKSGNIDVCANTNKLKDYRNDFTGSTKDTPALMVDTTLLSYDDEVETVTNGIDINKMSRNSQKMSKSKNAKSKSKKPKVTVNVVAKTSKKPQMYYSTPLPMKPSDFNKFLKEQGMDVESVISPLHGQTALFKSWTTGSKRIPPKFKSTQTRSSTSPSSAMTHLSHFFSKYSTRTNNLRKKPKAPDKTVTNKYNATAEKSNITMKKKFTIDVNSLFTTKRFKREIEPVIDHVLERPYRSQNPHKRVKKLKLFRQKCYEFENSSKPKTKPGTEETFSPALQAKLNQLQDTKRISAPKTHPKSMPRVDSKFIPIFEPQFVPTFEPKTTKKSKTKAESSKKKTKTSTTERTTLFSTLEPAPDDSMSDTPLDVTGSLIFTSEDPRNKEVDITIINFDDVTKKHNTIISPQTVNVLQDESLDIAEKPKERRPNCQKTTKLIVKVDEPEDLSFESIRSNEKYETSNSSYRSTTEHKPEFNDIWPYPTFNADTTRSQHTTKSDSTMFLHDPLFIDRDKEHNPLTLLEKIHKHHGLSNPERVQISSHHYKYDIFYKNAKNPRQKVLMKKPHQNMTVYSVKSSTYRTRTSNVKYNDNKAITVREDHTKKKSKQGDKYWNRKWVTIGSKFRNGRNAGTDYSYQNDQDEMSKYNKKGKLVSRNLEKRFFRLYPKLNFIQNKLTLKRMTTTPIATIVTTAATPKASKVTNTKATTKLYTTRQSETTTDLTPSLDDLIKATKENGTDILNDNRLEDSLQDLRIQFANKKVLNAVDKIKAMTTDEPIDGNSYDITHDLSARLGLVHKNNSKLDDEEFKVLHFPTSDSDVEDDPDSVSFKIGTDTLPPHVKPTPQYQDYEDIIRDPEKAAKTASEKEASYKFEQNIFDKSMYGKKSFDGSVFEKAMFGLGTPGTIKGKTYSSILTDIMSYDVTPDYEKDKEKEKEDYYEASTLPDTVKLDSNVMSDASPASGKVTKKKGYSIFDSASIIYNKSYLSHFGLPNSKLLVLDPQKKTEKSTEKSWFPLSGNTLSVLFKNPLEGHLGFGVKPIIQVNQPKSGQGITLQVTPVPTPMEIVQAALSQKQMNPGWSQMPIFQNYNNWPQIQATSLGYNPIQTGVRYNTSEMYGIYMEPGILNYDYNPPIAPIGGDNFFVNLSTGLNAEKNSNHYDSRRFSAQTRSTPKINIRKSSSATSTYAHNTRKSISTPDPFPIKAYSYNKKTKSMSKNSNSYKDDTATVQTLPDVAQRNIKREIPNPDTYTAKDVAALEVIVDLMKNTLGYEEKDLGNLFTTANIIYPMKSIHQSHDTTNAIQVHIAIPCDGQNTKKRSPLEPVRVRKVFSAKMSTPVDLEYQVHSFESGTLDPPTTVASNDYGLSPGMYLLIDKPKSGYALKPVKANIDLSQIKSRQAVNMSAMDLKGETTLRHGNIKNLAKVTLSKNFISAVNKQLVELYENLTRANDSRMRKRRNTRPTTEAITPDLATNTIGDMTSSYRMRRVIDWEAVKKYFGFDKVCDCKCKANKPMCRACAASDAVIDELTFEFDNLGKYMKDHCTEIQTYFWVNPSGGLKLRDAVDRIDESLRNYYKRVKGKCHGRTCEALGNHIDKKRFAKSAIVVKQSSIENLVDDLISVTDDLNKILAIQTCYNDKLRVKGEEMIKNMNSCISNKPFGKRSDPEATKKKFVKNVYSLDNINVNIICNPEASTAESFENSNMHSMVTMANQKIQDQSHVPDNFLEFEVDNVKNHNKRKGFKGLFSNRNKKNKKLFTYFTVQETKTSKVPFKREANNKIEVPLVGDSGGTFWLEYLRAGTTIEPQIIKQAMIQKEPKLDVNIVQTNDLFLKDKEHSNNVDDSISSTTAENVLENFNEILNVFEKILDNKRNDHNDIFSRKLDSKVTIKIKSVKPTTSTESIVLLSNETNKTLKSTEIKSDQKIKSDASKTTMANISEKINEPSSTTASSEFKNKNSDITSKDKLPTDVVQQADLPSDNLPSTDNSSATLPQTYASTETNPILEETISSESLVSEEISTETLGTAADPTITESKYANSSENLLFENISSDVTSGETKSNNELDALKTDMSTEPNINQKSTTTSEETTTKITTAAASVTTEKPTQKKTSVSSKIGFLERMTAATNLLGLTNNFYLLKKTSPVLGHSDNNSTASDKDLNHVSRKPTENHPKIVIINEYDQLVDNALNENDKNSDKYKNLLLNIIQYEANRLNDEWYKIAYASDKYDGNKRSATLTGGTTWQSTSRTNLLEDSVTGTVAGTKKRGLLNKLVSKIGMKVVSSKKKVAHCSSSNYSTTNAITDKIHPRQTDKASAEFTTQGDETARIKTKGTVKSQTKQQKTIKPPEASHVYPSSHTVCDIQETFNHVTQRRLELPEKTFEAYVKDIPCFKYRRLQRSFFITHKSRRPKWDWIRNKRSDLDFDKNKNTGDNNVGYYDKFEMFVKDDDGIYRIMDRKKRDATRRSLNYQLRHLPLLKPGKNELYVMVGDTVTLDCPLRTQRSTYSQFNWETDLRDLLNCDNVRSDGSALVLRKVGPRNAGRYTCSVDGVVRSSTRVTVVTLPAVDVVFLPTYRTQRECNYDDLKAIQQLGREMSSAAKCGNICSIRIDEPTCQRDRATNRSLLRSTGVLTMSPRRVQCSVQCRRDLFSSLLRLVVANLPPVISTRVVLHKDGFNETLKPLKYVGRPMNTHTLRKKDSSGHCEYHKFSSVAKPGQMKIVNLCNPGFYLLKELNVCAPCPANMSSSRGANTCLPCATGTAAGPGAAECHSVAHRLRRYDWWWYPPCGYVLAFGGVVCACGVCMVLGLLVHLGSRGVDPTGPCDRISSVCLDGPVPRKPHLMSGYMHSRTRPLSPSRVILARFFKPSLPSSRGTVFDSQETRFELWKEKNIPPSLPDIDFDIDTS